MGFLLDFIFPLECFICGRNDILALRTGICRHCYKRKEETDPGRCPKCKSLLKAGSCSYCSDKNVFFEELFYLRFRDEQEKEIIRRVKFSNSPWLARYFCIGLRRIAMNLKKKNIRFIIHVPSSGNTRKNRPYLSSEPVIESLQRLTGCSIMTPVKKVSEELQSNKTYFERFIHANTAYGILPEFSQKLKGNFLVVDDIFTTGASVNEISRILLANGAEKVYILILARNRELTDTINHPNLGNH